MFYLWFVIIALATLALVPVARRIGRTLGHRSARRAWRRRGERQ